MKLLIVIGTRPEAIKMFPVILELSRKKIKFEVCVTGQHRHLLNEVLSFFQITPKWDLNLMRDNQEINLLAANIFASLNNVLKLYNPDIVLVQGDTTTATMAALSSFYYGSKVMHIEAGLRTFDINSPFPEELNRQIIARMCTVHFAPTVNSRNNLISEGIKSNVIKVTGNTTIDSLFWTKNKIESGYIDDEILALRDFFLKSSKKTILITVHRRENFGEIFNNLMELFLRMVTELGVRIIWPIHPNPSIYNKIKKSIKTNPNIEIIAPLNYPGMIYTMMHCDLILTDSGGIQEEAPTFGKPIFVLRKNTERIESIKSGQSIVFNPEDLSAIFDATKDLLHKKNDQRIMNNPFGDGKAALKIVKEIMKHKKV